MRKVFVIILLMVSANLLLGQTEGFTCPWDEIDCPGKCGRYYDADGDGFCDYGRISKSTSVDTPVVEVKEVVTNHQNHSVPESVVTDEKHDSLQKDTGNQGAADESASETEKNEQPAMQRGYSLITITLLVLLLYSATSLLHRRCVIRKFVHRRIWNVALAITFLTSAILGLLLVIQINYHFATEFILSYLYWHVQFGIAMAIIALIHVFWHWRYFYMIFAPKSNCEKNKE